MSTNPEHTWGHTIPFGEAYYRKALDTLSQLREDSETITEIAQKVVETMRAGNTVYMNVTTGHMPTYELSNDREGNPAPFEFTGADSCTPEQYAAMKAGDMLLTNAVSEAVRDAHELGVYVVIFTTCYVNCRQTPAGRVHPNPHDWMPEDIASQVVNTPIPWQQGLIDIPEMPYMEAFPGSANVSCAIHWMITAETARAMKSGGIPDGEISLRYLDLLMLRIEAFFKAETADIESIAVTLAKRFLDGGHYFVRSRNEGVQSEVNGVAQGLMMANLFEPRAATEGGDKDVMLIAMVGVEDPKEIAWATEAEQNGNFVIGIGPGENAALMDLCDVYLQNRCDEPAGVLEVEGFDAPICPASGIINNVIVQSLQAQFVDEMCRRGAVPYFYMGGYRIGGGAFNEMMRPLAVARGY